MLTTFHLQARRFDGQAGAYSQVYSGFQVRSLFKSNLAYSCPCSARIDSSNVTTAAACGIYGIRNAGLAICVGVWSSCYVITSFIWGILIFKEEVKNVFHTGVAFTTLGIGLIGMSQYSKPQPPSRKPETQKEVDDTDADSEEGKTTIKRKTVGDESYPAPASGSLNPLELAALVEDDESNKYSSMDKPVDKGRVVLFGGRVAMTKRQLGVCGAMVNGLWGGLNLIPLHFAKREGFGGAAYLVSYAVGSMIVNTMIWVVLFLFQLHKHRYNFRDAVDSLPDFHLDKLWAPGFLAGSLYSIANFGSILAVTYLGQGVGFSLCQVQILVSGKGKHREEVDVIAHVLTHLILIKRERFVGHLLFQRNQRARDNYQVGYLGMYYCYRYPVIDLSEGALAGAAAVFVCSSWGQVELELDPIASKILAQLHCNIEGAL